MHNDPDALVRLTQEQYQKLLAENARYREALENIANLGSIFEENASAQVAREALKGGE